MKSKVTEVLLSQVEAEFKKTYLQFQQEDLSEVLSEIHSAFEEEEASLRKNFSLALEQKNLRLLAQSAHALKGTFAALGQKGLFKILEKVESEARCETTDWNKVQETNKYLTDSIFEILTLIHASKGITVS